MPYFMFALMMNKETEIIIKKLNEGGPRSTGILHSEVFWSSNFDQSLSSNHFKIYSLID
jgi:hypothetical protein